MNVKKFLQSRTFEKIKLSLIMLLFFSMLFLFYRYTEAKMHSVGGFVIGSAEEFPAEKLWIFTGDTYRASLAEAESPYIFPSSIALRSANQTSSVAGQKNTVLTVYNDITQYVSEILGPSYQAVKAEYSDYVSAVNGVSDYILLSYPNDFSAYIFRIYCDRTATDGFYDGDLCRIKKIMFLEGENGKLCAYTIDSENNVMYFSPLKEAMDTATEYSVTTSIPIAYTENKTLAASEMAFESDFFSKPDCNIAPDVVLTPNMQFYEIGIINPLSFIDTLSTDADVMKNGNVLSILESFFINTGLVRHYTDNNVIYFIDRNASLELSAEGRITYVGENGGIPLSKVLNNTAEEFSFADKLTAAVTLMTGLSRNIICGNGDLMLSSAFYNHGEDIVTFEFAYTFDSIPFHGLEKIRVDIGAGSILRADIPTYNFYRYSTRKIALISPEISYTLTDIPENVAVTDYRPEYVLTSKGNTASVGWVAATDIIENNN